MATRWSSLMFALLGYLPLLLVAGWAYAPAEPHAYPSVEILLREPYSGAGQATAAGAMYLRLLLMVGVSLLAVLTLLRWTKGPAQALFAGGLGSLVVLLPAWVPVVMELRDLVQAGMALSLWAVAGLGLILAVRRLPAIALPLAVLCLLAGVGLSVRTAAEVVLRSQPPLFVLAEAVRKPQSADAQLAVGLHLYSIGGVQEALPFLRRAGEALQSRFAESGEEALLRAARQLAALAPYAENGAVRNSVTDAKEQ